jgi:hypothetical protein
MTGGHMQAYRIGKYIIAADFIDDAIQMFIHEIGEALPDVIEEVDFDENVECDDGRIITIKEFINEELDNRQAWQLLGIPCETYRPFIIKVLP